MAAAPAEWVTYSEVFCSKANPNPSISFVGLRALEHLSSATRHTVASEIVVAGSSAAGSGAPEAVAGGGSAAGPGPWRLGDVSFMAGNGAVGSMLLDTGANRTVVTREFAVKAGLRLRSLRSAVNVKVADGTAFPAVGETDLTMTVQLLMELDDGNLAHWDRHFVLHDVLVIDFGDVPAPRSLYVAWQDWGWDLAAASPPVTPLALLAYLVLRGAKLLDARRVPAAGAPRICVDVRPRPPEEEPRPGTRAAPARAARAAGGIAVSAVVPVEAAAAGAPAAPAPSAAGPVVGPEVAAASQPLASTSVAATILTRMPPEMAARPELAAFAAELEREMPELGNGVDPAKCVAKIEFRVIGEPVEVGHNIGLPRSVDPDAFRQHILAAEMQGMLRRVPAHTPAYGFSLVVPKPGGKFRIVYNPVGINGATARIDPEGGVMPDNMITEAWKVRGLRYAVKIDLRDAFNMFVLGPEARRLSTFQTPVGKIQMLQGWFGWHSFPNAFQKLMMERVVLPTKDEFPPDSIAILDWIDDIVLAARTVAELMKLTKAALQRIYALGGRLSLTWTQAR